MRSSTEKPKAKKQQKKGETFGKTQTHMQVNIKGEEERLRDGEDWNIRAHVEVRGGNLQESG